MRRLLRLFVLAALCCGFAATASAQGVNLSWLDCGASGVADRTFACTSNTGNNDMYASVVAPTTLTQFVGIDVVMDLISATNPLPDWWSLNSSTGCRTSSLTMVSDFSASTSGGAACTDFFQGGGGGGIGAYRVGEGGITNRARIVAFWAVPVEGTLDQTETYMFRLRVNNARTVGTGACAGCLDQVCIVLNSINLAQPAGVGDYFMTGPPAGGRDFVTWQGAGANCALVPTKNKTWGQVKSLYR